MSLNDSASTEFRQYAHQFVDWMADYIKNIEQLPVKAQTQPNDIKQQLAASPPEHAESIEAIFEDFKRIIMPGMTHWQHPSFFAYFPANASPPSILAEMLTSVLAAQCMSWQTSPAATELETQMMVWLAELIGLPKQFSGVIQDTASTATLCAILSARERCNQHKSNQQGLFDSQSMTVYCSTETHSSVEKAVKIAGLGSNHLRKISVDQHFSINTDELRKSIESDIAQGLKPSCVVATLGTTSVGSIDSIETISQICQAHSIWLHIDAAWGGSALVLQENRWMIKGVEHADSFVFNPHKWLLTQFDCSAYFVQDQQALLNTFEILPEYLKTKEGDQVINYRDWGIPLGRRFRALKLWFVLRYYGVQGLQDYVRNHIQLAQYFTEQINKTSSFELMAPQQLGLICFRYKPDGPPLSPEQLDKLNERLLNRLNDSGKLYLTHTRIKGSFSLRMAIGGVYTQQQHIDQAWQTISETANQASHALDEGFSRST